MFASSFAIIAAGFALGLAGSVHCAGMCGPIVIALPRDPQVSVPSSATSLPKNGRTMLLAFRRLLYQFGRVVTYSALGVVIGLGASAINLAGLSREISISVGALMLALAISQLWIRRELNLMTTTSGLAHRISIMVQGWMRSLFARHGTSAHFGIGLVNGLLPCGLVTTALLASLTTRSISGSALFMGSFGLGTVPLMSALAIFGLAIPCQWRARIRFAAPVLTLILALTIITRGLGLGIPYISPAVASAAHPMSCCAR